MDYKINVLQIDDTWNCCNYKWRVFVKEYPFEKREYILSTLIKWFGAAEYFDHNWTKGHVMFLCGLKVR